MGLASFNAMRRSQAAKAAVADPETETPLTVGKGPGGKFYVKQGKKIVKGPFASEEDAKAAMVAPDGEPTPIPEAWEAMTDEELLALAAELSGGPVAETGNGTPIERARFIIQATVDKRASRENGQ